MVQIGFIGAGMVGTALATVLHRAGNPVSAVYSEPAATADRFAAAIPGCAVCRDKQALVDTVDLVFVTTPDDVIRRATSGVRWRSGQQVVHCSGAASVEVLEPARAQGAEVAGMHPLQTFPDVAQAVQRLPGSYFGLEGNGPIIATLEGLVSSIGGKAISLGSGKKALYHAVCCLPTVYLVTLAKIATDIFAQFGISGADALQAMIPMIQGNVDALRDVGLPRALTGPMPRGDVGTVAKHLQALGADAPELLPLYRLLGLEAIPIALAKGPLDERQAAELRALLTT